AAALSALSLNATTALPLSPAAAAGSLRSKLAVGAGARGATWATHVVAALSVAHRAQIASLRTDKKRPLAMIDLGTEPCGAGGTVSMMLDDRDGNQDASVGDVATFVFTDCRDAPDETINGEVAVTVQAINADATALTADVDVNRLSAASAKWTLTLDGTLRLAYSTPSVDSPIETYDLRAVGPVTASVSSRLSFNDTGTLADGWHEVSTYDTSVAPVAGNVEYGKGTLTVEGRFRSATAGGTVEVSTPTAFVNYGEDAYPRVGVMHVKGQASALRLRALSADNVQIELDANGDGTYESSKTESWDWLL
ncbi:MAG: hypothetical protein OEU93_13820, partial [Rubrivivax sp.]|nr:hypothetical protein [Rubrivivax sp.]